MTFDVRRAREALPAVTRSVFLNAGTFGPLPRPVAAAMHAHVEASLEVGRIGHAGIVRWLGLMERARSAFAITLGARAEEVALTHCTTDGCNTVVWGLAFEPGDEVVTTTHEHPGLTAPIAELARAKNVRVVVVPPEADAIVDAVGPRTKLVALSHVLWTTGEVLPIESISERVRSRAGERAFVLVDGAQSVGAIDVCPSSLGVDAYTASGQKWLCGPSGTGALWVREGALPRLATPWPWYLSKHRGASGVSDWTTARRLDASTIGMTSLAGLTVALDWHNDHRRDGALVHAKALAAGLRDRLRASSRVEVLEVRTPSQLVSFRVRGEAAAMLVERLEVEGILVRSIPDVDCVRASVGFWNDDGDRERLLASLGA